jgi:hypothetical protein
VEKHPINHEVYKRADVIRKQCIIRDNDSHRKFCLGSQELETVNPSSIGNSAHRTTAHALSNPRPVGETSQEGLAGAIVIRRDRPLDMSGLMPEPETSRAVIVNLSPRDVGDENFRVGTVSSLLSLQGLQLCVDLEERSCLLVLLHRSTVTMCGFH